MTAAPLLGNALHLPLRPASVDLVVTSPPYWALRHYPHPDQLGAEPTPDDYLAALLTVTVELVGVLKPSGSMFVNLGDKYQDKALALLPERYRVACADQLGLTVRAVVVWAKANGLPEPSATDRVTRRHEDWVHLTLGPDYYSATDPIRQPHLGVDGPKSAPGPGGPWRGVMAGVAPPGGDLARHPLGKMPSSVWTLPVATVVTPPFMGLRSATDMAPTWLTTEGRALAWADEHGLTCADGYPSSPWPRAGVHLAAGPDHFAAYPPEWPRRLILGWSPEGGVVLDPFNGTGTTTAVAGYLGRLGVGLDLSADYVRLARWRATNDARLRSQVNRADAWAWLAE